MATATKKHEQQKQEHLSSTIAFIVNSIVLCSQVRNKGEHKSPGVDSPRGRRKVPTMSRVLS